MLSRGNQYAAQDRVATAVMEQASVSLGAAGAGIGAKLMAGAILISTFGCVNGMLLAGARVYYAMSKRWAVLSIGRGAEAERDQGVPANSLWLQWGVDVPAVFERELWRICWIM